MSLPQQSSNTQPTSSKMPEAVAAEGGFLFERKVAALIGLRGMQRDDNFELSSNTEEDGKFDDLVYRAGGRRYYLQLKHSYKSDKYMDEEELKNLLPKCFVSYLKIKINSTDNTKFVIYTNRELDPKLPWCKKKYTGDDIFFKTCDNGIFTFSRDDTGRRNDVHTLLENAVRNGEIHWASEYPSFTSLVVTINKFLNELIMVTGQKGSRELDALIAEEIRSMDTIKLSIKECKSVLYHFRTSLGTWWRSRERHVLDLQGLKSWLQKAKAEHFVPFVTGLINICTKKLVGTGIKFSDSEVSRLQTELSDNRAVHLKSDALTLCSKLLLDCCLPQSKYIFVTFESLQNNKDTLLYAWLGGHWDGLIVFCDSVVQQSDILNTCKEIPEIIKRDPSSKRIIFLTACSVQQITGFHPVEHKFKFEQLSEESQEDVLDKTIHFQGCEVTMRSVLHRHGNVQHVLGNELVTDLITEGTTVNIGGTLQPKTEHYEPRVLKRKIWLTLDILKNRNTYPDIFAVSGVETSELVDIVPSEEEVCSFSVDEDNVTESTTQYNDVLKKRFIVLQGRNMKSSFLKLCDIHSKKTLHWLKYKDGKLLWKETCGSLQELLNFIDADKTRADKKIITEWMKGGSCEVNEEAIWNLGQRTVLVVAEPGMGKSSTTTQVAWNTKLADPTSWVVRINWNDHTRKLQDIDAATFNLDSLVEFLCSVALPESKYSDINRSLFIEALQNSGNVTVLMDGFDEICPIHADKAAVILSKLMTTKVGRVWVTSRPVQRERLEKELSVIPFSLKKLSYESQMNLFKNIWKRNANGYEDVLKAYVELLLKLANKSVYQRNFTGCPLHIMMIASVFEGNLETCLKRKTKISLPNKLDLLELYDTFIERKLRIYETEKKSEDLTKASVQDDHEILKKICVENLEKCSLLVTLPSELNPLSNEEIQSKIQPFIKRAQDGKEKIGIVMNVVEDRPNFVHRTFAEYLTANWFSKNFESNRSVLEIILFDSSYGIVKDVFDRILAKGYLLHCAVLDWDTDAVENLLKGGSDVNVVDSGGRTAMHLIAAEGRGDRLCEEITCSLLRYRASVDEEDNVLHFTPLGYAIKAENWLVVEQLLKRNCNTNDLGLVRQRINDESYIGRIIDDIEGKNYSLLLHHLANICANTRE